MGGRLQVAPTNVIVSAREGMRRTVEGDRPYRGIVSVCRRVSVIVSACERAGDTRMAGARAGRPRPYRGRGLRWRTLFAATSVIGGFYSYLPWSSQL